MEILVDNSGYPTERSRGTRMIIGRWGWAMRTWARC